MSSCSQLIHRLPARHGDKGATESQHQPHCTPTCDACLDVFRLAIVVGDQHAWRELHRRYQRHVSGWCRQASAGAPADIEELVNLTWQRFWQYFTAEKLESATTIAAVLQYLKLCAGSVVVDAVRARAKETALRRASEDAADAVPASKDSALDHSERMDLWRIVECHTRDAQERAVMVLRYRLGLRAAEVQERRPDIFPTVADVYRVNRNVLERLRRSPAMRAWYDEGEAAS
jgi:hypothetical protein